MHCLTSVQCPVHKPNGIPSQSTSYNGPMPHFPYLPTSEGSESRASCFSSIGKGEGGVGRIGERRSADPRVRSPTSWNRWSSPSRKPAQAQTPQTRRDQYIYLCTYPRLRGFQFLAFHNHPSRRSRSACLAPFGALSDTLAGASVPGRSWTGTSPVVFGRGR